MNLHVIIGEDDFLVDAAAAKVVGDGEGLEVIDSLNATNEDLRLADLRRADAAFSTPPFLEPRKVTWWKNVGFLPQSGGRGAPSEAVKAGLENFARKLAAQPLPANQAFILSGPCLLKTSVFCRTLRDRAEWTELSAGKPRDQHRNALARAAEFARGQGLAFAPGAAEAFVARVGFDTRSLLAEVAKMRAYLGEKAQKIGPGDVAAVASPGAGVEPTLWPVTDALGARDAAAAVQAAQAFEGEAGFAVMVTTVVEKFFRQLCELKDAQAQGLWAEATEGLAPFVAQKMGAYARNWTLMELRVARARFVQLRERSVSTSGAVDALVIPEIIRACVRPGKG